MSNVKIADAEIFSIDSNVKEFSDLNNKKHSIDLAKISFRASITIAEKYPRIVELSTETVKNKNSSNDAELYKIMAEVFSAICLSQDREITVDFVYDYMEFTQVSFLLRECMESVRSFLSKQLGREEAASQEEQSA